MLTLISGLPGASKTLNAIALAEAMREKEPHRPVYYWNIGDVTLPGWVSLGNAETFDRPGEEPDRETAERWFDCPDGAIIVLDECQKLWRKRGQGAGVPAFVSRLETHRKQGHDLIALTQHPKLVDSDVRKLVGRHLHYRRIFGTETFHCWEWGEAQSDPESTAAQSRALETRGRFPAKFYGTYRSAAVHNVKRNLPWKWIVTIAVALVAVPLLGWWAVHHLRSRLAPGPEPAKLSNPGVSSASGPLIAPVGAGVWQARARAPRVQGVEASAPIYDKVVHVVSVPRVAGCMQLNIGTTVQCQCTSQQGTVMDLSVVECVRIVKRGRFDFMRADDSQAGRPPALFSGPVPGAPGGDQTGGGG